MCLVVYLKLRQLAAVLDLGPAPLHHAAGRAELGAHLVRDAVVCAHGGQRQQCAEHGAASELRTGAAGVGVLVWWALGRPAQRQRAHVGRAKPAASLRALRAGRAAACAADLRLAGFRGASLLFWTALAAPRRAKRAHDLREGPCSLLSPSEPELSAQEASF